MAMSISVPAAARKMRHWRMPGRLLVTVHKTPVPAAGFSHMLFGRTVHVQRSAPASLVRGFTFEQSCVRAAGHLLRQLPVFDVNDSDVARQRSLDIENALFHLLRAMQRLLPLQRVPG